MDATRTPRRREAENDELRFAGGSFGGRRGAGCPWGPRRGRSSSTSEAGLTTGSRDRLPWRDDGDRGPVAGHCLLDPRPRRAAPRRLPQAPASNTLRNAWLLRTGTKIIRSVRRRRTPGPIRPRCVTGTHPDVPVRQGIPGGRSGAHDPLNVTTVTPCATGQASTGDLLEGPRGRPARAARAGARVLDEVGLHRGRPERVEVERDRGRRRVEPLGLVVGGDLVAIRTSASRACARSLPSAGRSPGARARRDRPPTDVGRTSTTRHLVLGVVGRQSGVVGGDDVGARHRVVEGRVDDPGATRR